MPGAASSTPAADAGLRQIQQAFEKWDAIALRDQRRQKRFGFFTALLGPVAVLLLTVQILAFPHAGPVALTLIALELASLIIVLSFGFFNIGSPDEWMRSRLRAEVLRRERFLVLARVGPYLAEDDPANAIKRRLVIIDNKDTDPDGLVALHDERGQVWRCLLEDSRAANTRVASPDPNAFEIFYEQRLVDQKNWFSKKSAHFAGLDDLFEDVAKGVLVAALAVAAWHLAALYFGSHGDGARSTSQLITEILAIVLPPVGAAATGLQSLLEGRRLSRSYKDRARTLTNLESALVNLQTEFAAAGPGREAHEFQFKRLVLRTEEALASELLQWWLLRHS
ncbi:MAG TPA: hypothetical protein VLM38_21230 [Blastocatellia bacterium]|nr:hypothetical protein [Blastocatellia bacterium]